MDEILFEVHFVNQFLLVSVSLLISLFVYIGLYTFRYWAPVLNLIVTIILAPICFFNSEYLVGIEMTGIGLDYAVSRTILWAYITYLSFFGNLEFKYK